MDGEQPMLLSHRPTLGLNKILPSSLLPPGAHKATLNKAGGNRDKGPGEVQQLNLLAHGQPRVVSQPGMELHQHKMPGDSNHPQHHRTLPGVVYQLSKGNKHQADLLLEDHGDNPHQEVLSRGQTGGMLLPDHNIQQWEPHSLHRPPVLRPCLHGSNSNLALYKVV